MLIRTKEDIFGPAAFAARKQRLHKREKKAYDKRIQAGHKNERKKEREAEIYENRNADERWRLSGA